LYGNGKLLKDGWGEISSEKIALSKIESIGIEMKDQVKTYLVYAGIGLMVIGIIIFSKVIFSEDHTL
ncbi:MAG: hypothetical protein R3321_12165, partial [Nitrososphaeraceae archaeon]|nr:hypothetical protein [Nitrososphaeraceae archaeon]